MVPWTHSSSANAIPSGNEVNADWLHMDAASVAQVNAFVEAAMAPAQTAQAVNVAVMGQAIDAAQLQSSAMLQMMRDSLNPSVGSTLDITA
jgi:hypothetical protein